MWFMLMVRVCVNLSCMYADVFILHVTSQDLYLAMKLSGLPRLWAVPPNTVDACPHLILFPIYISIGITFS